MLVERMGQLHQQHLAFEALRVVSRQHLVEDRQRHFVLGHQDLVPIASSRFHALHQEFAAVVRGETDRRTAEGCGDDRPGAIAPGKCAAVRAAAAAAAAVLARAALGTATARC